MDRVHSPKEKQKASEAADEAAHGNITSAASPNPRGLQRSKSIKEKISRRISSSSIFHRRSSSHAPASLPRLLPPADATDALESLPSAPSLHPSQYSEGQYAYHMNPITESAAVESSAQPQEHSTTSKPFTEPTADATGSVQQSKAAQTAAPQAAPTSPVHDLISRAKLTKPDPTPSEFAEVHTAIGDIVYRAHNNIEAYLAPLPGNPESYFDPETPRPEPSDVDHEWPAAAPGGPVPTEDLSPENRGAMEWGKRLAEMRNMEGLKEGEEGGSSVAGEDKGKGKGSEVRGGFGGQTAAARIREKSKRFGAELAELNRLMQMEALLVAGDVSKSRDMRKRELKEMVVLWTMRFKELARRHDITYLDTESELVAKGHKMIIQDTDLANHPAFRANQEALAERNRRESDRESSKERVSRAVSKVIDFVGNFEPAPKEGGEGDGERQQGSE